MDGILDTSIIIDIARGYPPAIIWSQANPHLVMAITPIVWMEIVEGVDNKIILRSMLKLLATFQMSYPIPADMDWAMQQLQKFYLSHNVGMADCLIAAPAHRLNVPLYTRNLKHFSAILPTLAHKPY